MEVNLPGAKIPHVYTLTQSSRSWECTVQIHLHTCKTIMDRWFTGTLLVKKKISVCRGQQTTLTKQHTPQLQRKTWGRFPPRLQKYLQVTLSSTKARFRQHIGCALLWAESMCMRSINTWMHTHISSYRCMKKIGEGTEDLTTVIVGNGGWHWVEEVQRGEKTFSLGSLYKLEHLNTSLGKKYLCIKIVNALSEPSLVGLLPWRQPKSHSCPKLCHTCFTSPSLSLYTLLS